MCPTHNQTFVAQLSIVVHYIADTGRPTRLVEPTCLVERVGVQPSLEVRLHPLVPRGPKRLHEFLVRHAALLGHVIPHVRAPS